ncbi:MAG: RHS repeat domain-containing protein [Gammaproteobacteria bacterium]
MRVTTYSYYPSSLLETLTTPDGVVLTYTYDGRSRVTSITDHLNQSMTYTYDDYGNVIETETRSNDDSLARRVSSLFESRNRLIEQKRGQFNHSHIYAPPGASHQQLGTCA